MTYVDDLESDFSVFHRLDIWSVSFNRVMRLAPKLPAYGGALAAAMSADRQADAQGASVVEMSTPYPQAVDSSVLDDVPDTPDEVVAQLWEAALLKQYPQATGVRRVSDTEMERLVNGGS